MPSWLAAPGHVLLVVLRAAGVLARGLLTVNAAPGENVCVEQVFSMITLR